MSDEPIACVVDLHLRAILLAKPRIVIELTGVFPLPSVRELFGIYSEIPGRIRTLRVPARANI